MDIKYSRKEFEGYTHRFMVIFSIDSDWRNDTTMDIYSNSGDYEHLIAHIEKHKTPKAASYRIAHKATKEQDKLDSDFVRGFLENITNSQTEPHEVSKTICDVCNYEWVAVRPLGVAMLECPHCGRLVTFENK